MLMLDNMFTPTHLLLFLPFLLAWLAIYLLPTIIAASRHHPNRTAIILVNVLLGWTAIAWVVALIWAFALPAKIVVVQPPPGASPVS
jgi:hypothetical protein